MGTFMVQGVLVGALGIAMGVFFGVLLALNVEGIVKWIEHTFHVTFLSPDVYYISELPSDLHWSDVGWITRDRVRVLRVRDAVPGVARGADGTCGSASL